MKLGLREMTFFLLLLGIVGAAGYFVFLPHWRQAEQLDRDIQAKQAKLAQLDRIGQASESLTRELAELGKALDFFESKLPNDQQIYTVLREITQITDKHKLTTRSVSTRAQIKSADYVALPIEMEMSGPFEGTYRFLLDLERMPRITRISDMEIVKDKTAEGVVHTKLVMSVYFEPDGRSESGAGSAGATDRSTAHRPSGGAS